MLPKQNRLRSKKDFQLVYRRGKTFQDRYIAIKRLPSQLKKESRIGIVVSTKVSNKSTVRNKIKRRVRAIIMELLKENIVLGKMVIIIKKPAITLDYKELRRIITNKLENVS